MADPKAPFDPAPLCLSVPDEAGGERLDRFLAQALAATPHAFSRAAVQRLLQQNAVLVAGAPAKAATRVRAGQTVHVRLPAPSPSPLQPIALPLTVVHEDEALLAINKPAHLPVHPGAGVRRPTVVQALLHRAATWSGIGGVLRPGIVHRLDADTTGLLLIAKTDAAHRHLAEQFHSRRIRKIYLALAAVAWPTRLPRQGLIDTPFGRHPRVRQRFTGRLPSASKHAQTRYRCLASGDHLSLLRLRLLTGRTHQARVHCAELGLPLLGDAVYGTRRALARAESLGLTHQALHAWRLAFVHPLSGEPMQLHAPPPRSWWDLARTLDGAPSLG